jgi:hypothetical protein
MRGTLLLLVGCGRFHFDALADAVPDRADRCWDLWHAGSVEFDTPELVPIAMRQGNPSLLTDGRTLYVSQQATTIDLFSATRNDGDSPWGLATSATDLNSPTADRRVTLTGDGLTAIVSTDRGGSNDLWSATRASTADMFGPLSTTLLANVNAASTFKYDPELTEDGLTLYYAPGSATTSMLSMSQRTMATELFGPPIAIDPLRINASQGSPTISPDELVIAFSSASDLHYSTRLDRGTPFSSPNPIPVNTASDESDVELSANGCELYFTSNRAGPSDLYLARVR